MNDRGSVVGVWIISKKPLSCIGQRLYESEEEGFEPPVPFGTTVFKTVTFSRSVTPPKALFCTSYVQKTGKMEAANQNQFYKEQNKPGRKQCPDKF